MKDKQKNYKVFLKAGLKKMKDGRKISLLYTDMIVLIQ